MDHREADNYKAESKNLFLGFIYDWKLYSSFISRCLESVFLCISMYLLNLG